ncbi:NAD-dependent epimerase/dehydratase family protein [Sulfuricurvum sp.]|uniref:NAD-dependent epimerase/dehydratase family protein n=1 Tax=Sulfuricurvum sp. TaxID=2025608 RepID=UPI003BB63B11
MENLILENLSKSFQNIVPKLEQLKGSTILITGGTGFVGSWIARALVWLNDDFDFGCKIILLSRDPENLERSDPKLYRRSDITYLRSDIRSVHNLPSNINYIIHAAANPDNRVHMSDPVNTMDVIALGTKAIMDAATRLPDIRNIVHISSGQVYGKAPDNGESLRETILYNFSKNDITSVYPEAKRYAETICLAYRSLFKLPVCIVRPFSFIGPYQKLNKPWAINTFLQEALNNQPMRIVGNGKPQRSYLYASDMAAWLLVVLAEGKSGDIYNLGSSEGISLKEVTEKINKLLPRPVDVIVQNYNNDESKFIPNLEHIIKKFSLKMVFDFDEALQQTMQWNVNNLHKEDK